MNKPLFIFGADHGLCITRTLFLRGLAVIYLLAFISLGTQLLGLVGSQGILPAHLFLQQAQPLGLSRFWLVPTLAWISASDMVLRGLWMGGAALAVLALTGLAPGPLFFGQWLLYLSLVTIGGDFLSFQWDALLLETGLLAIFLAPWRLRPAQAAAEPASRVMIWLLRWLLFRLMLQSAWVKWASGDALWHHLTALTVHFETQPLPNTPAWFAHQLPAGLLKALCGILFLIEGAVPVLIFAGRRPRLAAFCLLAALQSLIFLTGNYGFFNLLTLVLCIALLDDQAWKMLWDPAPSAADGAASAQPRAIVRPAAACFLFAMSLIFWSWQLGLRPARPLARIAEFLYPFRSVNDYGLFAEMTPLRREIEIEGSDDNRTWKVYEFNYKPQALEQRPRQVAPFQPRLDWQMWFAALSDYRHNPWFLQFCFRLLQGSPPVLRLLRTNPFPDHPPAYLRASLYEYHFTTVAERRATGHWWKREYQGVYLPAMSLRRDAAAGGRATR